ncbi:Uncharacterised protein [Chlamydia trachomatis]|nr:Uncharacterised protein [Chlamydia trachomatis]
MPCNNCVYAINACDLVADIFFADFIDIVTDTGVRKDENDISASFLHRRNNRFYSFNRVFDRDFAFKKSLVPVEDLRWNNSGNSDVEVDCLTICRLVAFGDDFVRFVAQVSCSCVDYVGINDRHTCS